MYQINEEREDDEKIPQIDIEDLEDSKLDLGGREDEISPNYAHSTRN